MKAAALNVRPTAPKGVLTGPADADNFRVQVGRYGDRWYTDPLEGDATWVASDATFPSVSTIKKASGSDWSFVAMKRINEAVSANPARFDGMTPEERYEAFKSANTTGLSAAARRGTNVHLIAEGLLYGTGDMVGDGDPGAEYRTAVEDFFAAHAPELVAAEFVCFDRDMNGVGYAGTADALVRINGSLYLVDWKSRGDDSKHGAYAEEAAQVAAYARAQYMIVEGAGGSERRALPDIAGGLIVSIKPDGYRVYPIDLDAGFRHWTALHAWWAARRSERDAIGRQWPAKAATTRTPGDEQETVRARPKPDDGDEVVDDTYDVLQREYNNLSDEGRAWIKTLAEQATRAAVSFRSRGHRTVRRYAILRSLVMVAQDQGGDITGSHVDKYVRDLLEPIIGDVAQFPTVPLGQLVGSLSAPEAAKFSGLLDGRYVLLFTQEGRPTLRPAA